MKKPVKITESFKDHLNKWREITQLYIGSILLAVSIKTTIGFFSCVRRYWQIGESWRFLTSPKI